MSIFLAMANNAIKSYSIKWGFFLVSLDLNETKGPFTYQRYVWKKKKN